MNSCNCPNNVEFFDLEYLKASKLKKDVLVDEIKFQNANLTKYYRRNNAIKQFNDVTMNLVRDFKHRANKYIDHLRANKHDYGTLYLLANSNTFNLLYIEYCTFPLIHQPEKKSIIQEIEKMASATNALEFKITCLELLYFYALLVNPDYNWVIIDYISNGNKNHQYVMLNRHCLNNKSQSETNE